ncbi:hypothetical protein ACYCFL_05000 [Stutzerimonas nitrititolerans]|uniref:hypothetical protein n=1 Tax=Stutzerimonas nitrititolerans TaxID=2482751 RepID=UPI001BDC4C5F|nr:hypothetical protein [Stutzerimonas nitrititolerans]MBT1118655.1 hypothetical protein [Stutzerimonas nitrititolerans]
MAFVTGLIATLFLAGYLRGRRVKALPAIAGAGLVLPVLVAFTSFVYPAGPEARMWAEIAIPVSYLWGMTAAGLGYGVAALALIGRRDI